MGSERLFRYGTHAPLDRARLTKGTVNALEKAGAPRHFDVKTRMHHCDTRITIKEHMTAPADMAAHICHVPWTASDVVPRAHPFDGFALRSAIAGNKHLHACAPPVPTGTRHPSSPRVGAVIARPCHIVFPNCAPSRDVRTCNVEDLA
jgi:hypothetical protein